MQLAAIRDRMREQDSQAAGTKSESSAAKATTDPAGTKPYFERDFEGGFGGQEDLEDRYATTSGEH